MLSVEMGRLVITIPDELEREFREAVYKRYGMRKGNITKAVIDALKMWVLMVNKELESRRCPDRGELILGDNKGSSI